jgi:hypothetical protein
MALWGYTSVLKEIWRPTKGRPAARHSIGKNGMVIKIDASMEVAPCAAVVECGMFYPNHCSALEMRRTSALGAGSW